jgi:hypothetical protein
MKPISQSIRLALVVTMAFCLADGALLMLLPGCGTTPETKIAQGAQIVITSVNDAMAEWTAYVNAGKAKQSQIDTVKTAYTAYYGAVQVLKAVCEKMAAKDPNTSAADLATANAAVTNAENTVLSAVAQILNAVVKKV